MGKYEDALAALRKTMVEDYGVPSRVLEQHFDALEDASEVRQDLKDAKAKAARVDELEKELRTYKLGPKIEEAFKEAGVAWDELRPLERKTILKEFKIDGDEIDEEAVTAFIKDNDIPVDETNAGDDLDQTSASQVLEQGTEAHRKGRVSSTKISPEDTESWSTEKLLRLREQHPEAFEQLKKGDTVHVAFS